MSSRSEHQRIRFATSNLRVRLASISLFYMLLAPVAYAQSSMAAADQDGVYIINNLIPSNYKVTAEAAGFQTYLISSFPLQANQETVLNATLQLGTMTQTVEVSGQVQMTDPSNATLGEVTFFTLQEIYSCGNFYLL